MHLKSCCKQTSKKRIEIHFDNTEVCSASWHLDTYFADGETDCSVLCIFKLPTYVLYWTALKTILMPSKLWCNDIGTRYNCIYGIHVYFYTAITIDPTLCYNLTEEFQESEETDCSPYEYDNLTSLVKQVCNTISSVIS